MKQHSAEEPNVDDQSKEDPIGLEEPFTALPMRKGGQLSQEELIVDVRELGRHALSSAAAFDERNRGEREDLPDGLVEQADDTAPDRETEEESRERE